MPAAGDKSQAFRPERYYWRTRGMTARSPTYLQIHESVDRTGTAVDKPNFVVTRISRGLELDDISLGGAGNAFERLPDPNPSVQLSGSCHLEGCRCSSGLKSSRPFRPAPAASISTSRLESAV